MTSAAVRSKAVILLLTNIESLFIVIPLILCFVLFGSLFCCEVSFRVTQSSTWGRVSCLIYFDCLLMSCDCWFSVSLPHCAVSGSAVCDCGISW